MNQNISIVNIPNESSRRRNSIELDTPDTISCLRQRPLEWSTKPDAPFWNDEPEFDDWYRQDKFWESNLSFCKDMDDETKQIVLRTFRWCNDFKNWTEEVWNAHEKVWYHGNCPSCDPSEYHPENEPEWEEFFTEWKKKKVEESLQSTPK